MTQLVKGLFRVCLLLKHAASGINTTMVSRPTDLPGMKEALSIREQPCFFPSSVLVFLSALQTHSAVTLGMYPFSQTHPNLSGSGIKPSSSASLDKRRQNQPGYILHQDFQVVPALLSAATGWELPFHLSAERSQPAPSGDADSPVLISRGP